MSKVIRITSGTEKVLEEIKQMWITEYEKETGAFVNFKEDDILRTALMDHKKVFTERLKKNKI